MREEHKMRCSSGEISNGHGEDAKQYRDSILRIAEQMKNVQHGDDEKKSQGESTHEPFRIDENFDESLFLNPTKEQIVKLLKRKFIANLKILKPFVDVMKYKTSTKGVSICPIPSTSKLWNLLYGSQRQVSRLIECAKRIGLLYCVSDSYSNKMGYCKEYAYDKRVERKSLELFNDYGISNQSKSYNQSYVMSIIDTFNRKGMDDERQYELYNAYMKKSKIRIAQRTRLPLKECYLVKGLNEVYPQYGEMLKTIDEDNANMDELIDHDYALPTFTMDRKNENVVRIGIRKTNAHCNLKVHGYEDRSSWESLCEREKNRIRDFVIEKRLGGIHENDVKSSIYRITYLLNKGVWLDREIDLYPIMAGFDFKSKEERNLFKSPLAMKIYFSPSIEKAISTSIYNSTSTKELFKSLNAKDVLLKAKENMVNAIGSSYRSEIFLHESCIYTQVAHKIRQMGYRLIQIYDGFFTDKPLDEKSFDEIVKECALDYYNKWNGHWHVWERVMSNPKSIK